MYKQLQKKCENIQNRQRKNAKNTDYKKYTKKSYQPFVNYMSNL